MTEDEILASLLVVNANRCRPPLPGGEVERIAGSVSKYEPAAKGGDHVMRRWPEPMEDAAYHGLVGEVVRAIAPHTEAAPEALLMNFLAAFGNAVGREPHAIAQAQRHGLNIFTVLVGETAKGRKCSSWGHIEGLFEKVDAAWTSNRIQSGLSSGEGVIWAVRNPIYKMEAIKEKGKYTGKRQLVTVDPGVDDKRLLVLEGEFASPLKVMAREGNTLSPVIQLAWDNRVLQILTKNSPATAKAAHISILGHITKEELLRHLSDTDAGNGFANRILWICTRRVQVLPEGGGIPEYDGLAEKLTESLEKGRRIQQIQRDDAARELWAKVYPDLSEGSTGLFGLVTARAEAQVLRLSALYATMDGSSEIGVPHLEAALAVWKYAEASARYIFGDALSDPVSDRILRELRRSPEGLTRTDINNLFTRNIPAARIQHALSLLQELNLAACERRNTGGRPEETWKAC